MLVNPRIHVSSVIFASASAKSPVNPWAQPASAIDVPSGCVLKDPLPKATTPSLMSSTPEYILGERPVKVAMKSHKISAPSFLKEPL